MTIPDADTPTRGERQCVSAEGNTFMAHDWLPRQQGASRYCPRCDSFETLAARSSPAPAGLREAAQAVVDAVAAWHLPTTVGSPRLSDALIRLRAAITEDTAPVGLDVEQLAAAMNNFELAADTSAIVETNLGTHRADCVHVGWIAAEYARLAPPVDRDAGEGTA